MSFPCQNEQAPLYKEVQTVDLPPCFAEEFDELTYIYCPSTEVRIITRVGLAQMVNFIHRCDWNHISKGKRFKPKQTGLAFDFFYIDKGEFCLNISSAYVRGTFSSIHRSIYWVQGEDEFLSKTVTHRTDIRTERRRAKAKNKMLLAKMFYDKYPKHFVHTLQKVETQTDHFLFQEAYDGDLQELCFSALAKEKRIKVLIDAANSLSKIHQEGYLHRDIKMENILFRHIVDSRSKTFKLQIAVTDFDSCGPWSEKEAALKPGGTFDCCSPESLEAIVMGKSTQNDDPTLLKRDVWSFGMVIKEFMALRINLPWGSTFETSSLMRQLTELRDEPSFTEYMAAVNTGPSSSDDDPLTRLCLEAFRPDPNSRPTMDQVISVLTQVV